MVKKRWTWGVPVGIAVLAAIAGGEPPAYDLPGGGALFWSGGESGPGPGYVAVRMHSPFSGRLVQESDGRDGMEEVNGSFRLDKGLGDPKMPVTPAPRGYRALVPADETVLGDSLFGEMSSSKASDSRSGWGWLADEVLQKRDADKGVPLGDIGQPADNSLMGPLRGADGGRGNDDPYAELYNVWQD